MTSTSTAPDAERRAWFGQFGYTGDLDEVVTLLGNSDTATVADVWETRRGLQNLHRDHGGPFHRVCDWAVRGREPRDSSNRLCTREYGPLTNNDGNWLPGRMQIVVALTTPRKDDDLFYELRDRPLEPATHAPAAKAA